MTSPSSKAVDLLVALRGAGVAVWPHDGDLHLLGHAAVPHDLRSALVIAKPGLVAQLEAEVDWRLAGMAEQARQVADGGCWPLLLARSTPAVPAHCLSCGEPLLAVEKTRCCLCQEAARRTIATTRSFVTVAPLPPLVSG